MRGGGGGERESENEAGGAEWQMLVNVRFTPKYFMDYKGLLALTEDLP